MHVYVGSFVFERELGEVFTADTRFVIPTEPESVLAPDIAFVRSEKLPRELSDQFARAIPDLVIEIVSPSNREPAILTKVADYLTGGVRLVWLVRPAQRTITVFRPDAPEVILGEGDVLDGGEVLPGFQLPMDRVFRRHGRLVR